MTVETSGRRERKKQLTRLAISDVATRLFMERGFDAVTVAEVAAAADVAVQTVFNHFPTKEDLFFDETGWWAGPAEAVRAAPTGLDVIEVLRLHYLTVIRNRLAVGHLATWRQFNATIEASPALRARRRRIAEEMEEMLAAAVLETSGLSGRMARLIAAQYAAAQKVLEGELARLVPVDATPAQLEEAHSALEEAVDEVFAVLARGFAPNH